MEHWIICVIQLNGSVTLCSASHPITVFTGWREDGTPIFEFLHHYAVEIAKAKCFDPSEVESEIRLLRHIGGTKYHVFSIPRPNVSIEDY